jgi:hypothetical protein
MGGGKSKSTSKSYSGSGQLWAQPHAQAAVGNVQGVFNQAQPGLQKLTDIAQNQLVPSLVNRFNQAQPGSDAARNYNMNVVNGGFMDGNPHLSAIMGRVRDDVGNDVNSMFARSGRYGSGAHQDVLTDSLADAQSNLLYQNYGTEMARRDAAAAALNQQGTSDAGVALGSLGVGAELPYTGANSLANSLGALFQGGTETTKTKQGSGLFGGLLGAAGQIGAAAISKSDRRLKTKIELLYREDDGLGWYRYAFKNKPDTMLVGTMADEVEKLRPEAHVPNFKGEYAGVNYAKLGSAFDPAKMAIAA